MNLNFNGCIAFFRCNLLIFGSGGKVHTTGRSNHHFALGFVIEVQQDVAFQCVAVHIIHTAHGRFFVHRDKSFQWSVLQRIVFHNRHDGSHGHAVVGAERCTFGFHPFAIDVGLYGVGLEVVR